MNKTVALVKAWGAFEENHPDGELEDFCRYYLAQKQRPGEKKQKTPQGLGASFTDGMLLRAIGRIHKLNMSYANMALKDTDLNQIEEFGILITIKNENNPRKTEVIYANLFELSSGTDMLARMMKRGLIREYDDPEDKRSKRLELTSKGEKTLAASFPKVKRMATMLMHDLTEDDKQLCLQLLKNIEIKFSALWPRHRGRAFEEVFDEVMSEE